MQIVFVCSGNTCRSPLALAAWHLASQRFAAQTSGASPLARIEATSAGLCASESAPAARYSLEVAREWGVDLSSHRAQLFRPQHARADLILTMTRDQTAVLRSHFEVGSEQVQLLGRYAPRRDQASQVARLAPLWGAGDNSNWFSNDAPSPQHSDILDPFGGSLEAYQAAGAQIRRCVFELARVLAILQ